MIALPIRLRLTLWYSIMFATAALLLSSTSWWMLRFNTDAAVQQDFKERVDDVRMQLHQLGSQPSTDEMQEQFDAVYRHRDDGKWLQIRDQDGEWIYRSARMASLDVPLLPPRSLPASNAITEFKQGTHNIRVFSSSILVDGRSYSVETGVAMNKQQALLQQFGLGLLLLTPAVLIAATLAGHMMSRKALAPVATIANEARRISDRNLDQRLPVPRATDEISHLSDTLNNMLARIDSGFRSVRDFTANASHELRTPLARLRTEIDIALLYPRSVEEYRDTLEHLQDVTVDMTNLTESLLSLARAEAGSDLLRLAPVDLRKVVETILAEWIPVTTRLSIDLRSEGLELNDLPQGTSLFALGDGLALLRLLRIWLDNACRFTPPGGRISIIVELVGETVLLALQDTGSGIPASQHKRIFERFYRLQGDTSKQRSGSGLGLSLAAWIAEQHKTSITLTSVPGVGSRFQVALVRVQDEDQPKSSLREIDLAQRSMATAVSA